MKIRRMPIELTKPIRARRKDLLYAYNPIAVRMEQIRSAKYNCEDPSKWRIPPVRELT
jgi:hypothetical protein